MFLGETIHVETEIVDTERRDHPVATDSSERSHRRDQADDAVFSAEFLTRRRWPTAISAASAVRLVASQHVVCDDVLLNLARPLVYLRDAGVAVEPLDVVVGDESGSAVDLYRLVGHVDGVFAGEQLCLRSALRYIEVARIDGAGGTIGKRPRSLDVGGHLRTLVFDGLNSLIG